MSNKEENPWKIEDYEIYIDKDVKFLGWIWVDDKHIPDDNDKLKVIKNGELKYEISAKLVRFAGMIFDIDLSIYVDEETTTFWYNDNEIVLSQDCKIYAVPILIEIPVHNPYKEERG